MLGYRGQLTDQAESLTRHRLTLFMASDHASPVRGAFNAQARARSTHITILRVLARLRTPHYESPPGAPTASTSTPDDTSA